MSQTQLATRRTRLRRLFLNPITIKELRSTFRQRRFLFVYWISLAVYSLVVLWLAAIEVGEGNKSGSDPVGQRVFNYCVAAQLALMVFVLPGFAATAVTDERENQSFDLLVTTALRAFDIVWGKFLACMSYAFLFLTATFPLVCVSILFTGVRPGEILFAYAVMAMVAGLMTAVGLATSATGRSSRRAVGVTYALAMLMSAGWIASGMWLRGKMPDSYSKLNLVGYCYDLVFHGDWASAVWAGVVPFVAWGQIVALLLVISVDRLKPTTANKSTNLRLLGVVLAATMLAAVLSGFGTTGGSLDDLVQRALTLLLMEAVVLAVFVVGAGCEDPRLSRRILWQYQWASGLKWPLRIVLPGSASGLYYVVIVGAVLLGVSVWGLSLMLPGLVPGAGPAGVARTTISRVTIAQSTLWWTAGLIAAMLWFYGALGRFCSTTFAGAIYTRTVVIFVFVMANLVPVCLMTLAEQTAPAAGSTTGEHPSTLLNVHYASTFLSVRSTWAMTELWPLPDRGLFRSKLVIRTFDLNQPVAKVSLVFHLALAAAFTLLAIWRQWRVIRPVLRRVNLTRRSDSATASTAA